MKKRNLKPMIISALLAVGFGATSVGTSFALFTDKAETKINVTSGKVAIDSQFQLLDAYSMDPADNTKSVSRKEQGTFVTGGTFTFDADLGKAVLTNVVPGDGISYKVKFDNNSNVAIKYRLNVSVANDTGLFSGLKVKFNGTELKASTGMWKTLAANAELPATEVVDGTLSIELPKEAGNEYQNKSCEITIGYEAVQGNAQVSFDPTDENEFTVRDAQGLKEFANLVNSGESFLGKTVTLSSNIDLNNEEWTPIGTETNPFKGTFIGGNKTISNLKILTQNSHVGLFGKTDTQAKIKDLKLHNANVKGASRVGTLVGLAYTGGPIENCHIDGLIKVEGNYKVGGLVGDASYVAINNSSVIGDTGSYVKGIFKETNLEGDNVGGLTGFTAEGQRTYSNLTVKNISVEGTRKVAGISGYLHKLNTFAGATVENCTISTNASSDYISSNENRIFVGGIVGEVNNGEADKESKLINSVIKNSTINGYSGAEASWPFYGGLRYTIGTFTTDSLSQENVTVNKVSAN